MDTPLPWRPPRLWRVAQLLARVVVAALARLRVTGDVPAGLRHGPLVLAVNHISPFDPVVLAAACRVKGVAPRIMATGGLFTAPVVGAAMRHGRAHPRRPGHRRGRPGPARRGRRGGRRVGRADLSGGADRARPGHVARAGRTGVARLAFASGTAVVPVAQWGAHEVLPYAAPRGLLRALARALVRRPVIRVHFGAPVELADLHPAAPGAARRATDRIIEAITTELAALRPDEPDRPRHVDATRPTSTARTHRRRPVVAGEPDRP